MADFTRGEIGQPGHYRKTLEGSVANLKNLFLVGLASVVISGCSGQRANAVWGSLGYDAASTAVSGAVVYGLNEMMSPPNYRNPSKEQRDAIRQHEIFKLKFLEYSWLVKEGFITNEQFSNLMESLNKNYKEGKL